MLLINPTEDDDMFKVMSDIIIGSLIHLPLFLTELHPPYKIHTPSR